MKPIFLRTRRFSILFNILLDVLEQINLMRIKCMILVDPKGCVVPNFGIKFSFFTDLIFNFRLHYYTERKIVILRLHVLYGR